MLYPQIICNDNVFSAVSFQINLWSAPANTPVPSDESFVLESWSQSDALLQTVYVGIVICAEICLYLWVALHSPPPIPQPLHSSHCWSLGGPCCLAITTA